MKAITDAINRPENKEKIGKCLENIREKTPIDVTGRFVSVYQVATVDPKKGVPRVRSQAHRYFLTPKGTPNLPVLLTSTDVRAEKVEHIIANPAVDLAW